MRVAVRGCGEWHVGVCWTERFKRWSRPGGWIPPEYRPGGWYRVTPEGRVPIPCRPVNTGNCEERQ